MSSAHMPFAESGARAYNPEQTVAVARRAVEGQLMNLPGVRGVGEGRDPIGNPAWIAYVTDRSAAAGLPKTIGGRAVIIEFSGEIDILPR